MLKEYVVLPTYHEAENLRLLLPRLKRYSVIVVDDDSRDGTKDVCRKHPNVRLFVRKKKSGLSSAVLYGIKMIREKDAKIVVMDADMQHDPEKLPEFFRKLDKSGFVYGSRHARDFSVSRRFYSWLASTLAKTMIPHTKGIDDVMSGYFGFRLKAVDIQKIKPKGYKIMLDVLVNLRPGTKTDKVYFVFGKRIHGRSKLGPAVIFSFLSQLLSLSQYRLVYFSAVGISGIVVNEGAAYLLHPFLPLWADFLIAIELSILSNFLLNHYITFHRRVRFLRALPRYNLVALVGLSVNLGVAIALSYLIFYLTADLIGIIAAFGFNYTLSERFAWAK